jgi:hypothetical protein
VVPDGCNCSSAGEQGSRLLSPLHRERARVTRHEVQVERCVRKSGLVLGAVAQTLIMLQLAVRVVTPRWRARLLLLLLLLWIYRVL